MQFYEYEWALCVSGPGSAGILRVHSARIKRIAMQFAACLMMMMMMEMELQ